MSTFSYPVHILYPCEKKGGFTVAKQQDVDDLIYSQEDGGPSDR